MRTEPRPLVEDASRRRGIDLGIAGVLGDIRIFGQIFSAIRARSAFTTRLRIPFWLIPLDLILTAPFLLPTSPETYTGMAGRRASCLRLAVLLVGTEERETGKESHTPSCGVENPAGLQRRADSMLNNVV